MKLTQSPIDSIQFLDRTIYVKRDELLHPQFSGNKARKFHYFLEQDYPSVNKLVSYGSCQANSLYSLSALAKIRNWTLDYYVDRIPAHVKQHPIGNYQGAIQNGANIVEFNADIIGDAEAKQSWLEQQFAQRSDTLFIPEGGRCEFARFGVHQLGKEIVSWCEQQNFQQLKVFLPAGTGTTALYLQEYFMLTRKNIQVFTCAVVGDSNYLSKQFNMLSDNKYHYPQILTLEKKYHFGRLYREFYEIWQDLNRCDIEFDLLYDPLGFLTILANQNVFSSKPLLYIHQGGLKGNETMNARYQRKFGK
ncbi:MAG: 1-aminocyclopropane-1-carboxylate deaminase/D-cysteine desulfhydrase [Parashewanella sp.]